MIMTELAGALRERVQIENRASGRDAIGGASGGWQSAGDAWAAIAPLVPADPVSADALSLMPRWQVTLRRREGVGLGSRLVWQDRYLAVRSVSFDPRDPARMQLLCEELR